MLLGAILLYPGGSRGASSQTGYWPARHWRTAQPESQGVDSRLLTSAIDQVIEQRLGVHSLLVIRHGYAVLHVDFYPYSSDTPHDLASVTKSITSALAGIAVGQGLVRMDQPLLSFFPAESPANPDPRARRITVGDVVHMESGLDCGYAPGEQELELMKRSPDFVRFALSLPQRHDPGTHASYCSPDTTCWVPWWPRRPSIGTRFCPPEPVRTLGNPHRDLGLRRAGPHPRLGRQPPFPRRCRQNRLSLPARWPLGRPPDRAPRLGGCLPRSSPRWQRRPGRRRLRLARSPGARGTPVRRQRARRPEPDRVARSGYRGGDPGRWQSGTDCRRHPPSHPIRLALAPNPKPAAACGPAPPRQPSSPNRSRRPKCRPWPPGFREWSTTSR